MMDKQTLAQLNEFLGRASKATYAGGGGEVKPWRNGFNELDYREGDLYYRDSYTGFLRSWGQEVVWQADIPVWTCLYGGGMSDERMDAAFASETLTFLKKAMSAGDKEKSFQPRGPKKFSDGDWLYACKLDGDITKFDGHEFISYKGLAVFTHDFFGGLVIR